jgi:hypothetical protein
LEVSALPLASSSASRQAYSTRALRTFWDSATRSRR